MVFKTVHRCSFVNLTASPITALAVTPTTCQGVAKLACSREDGSLEVYSILEDGKGGSLILDRKLPGIKGNVMRRLFWSHQTEPSSDYTNPTSYRKEKEFLKAAAPRLFSVGLTGLIIEWDLMALRPKRYAESHGGGIWCCALHPSHTSIAIGCEDGGIRLFNIKEDSLELERKLPQKPRRVLSLAWFPDGKHLVAGTDATAIEKWDTSVGKVTATMKVEYGHKWANTYLWDIVVIGQDTIVSGDSKGNVTLFEGEFGTMIATFRSHEVDILCLAANKDGTEFYSAGVDNKINRYIKSSVGSVGEWTVQSHRRHHQHDTLALSLFETDQSVLLFSGGMDMRLSFIDTKQFTFAPFHSLDAFPAPAPITLSSQQRVIMATYPDQLRLWKLGSASEFKGPFRQGTQLDLATNFTDQLTILTESSQNILCSAMSSKADWVAFSDISSLRLFKVTWPKHSKSKSPPVLSQVNQFPPPEFYKLNLKLKYPKELLFVKDELVMATPDGNVIAFDLKEMGNLRVLSVPFPNLSSQGFVISRLTTDPIQKFLSVSHSGHATVVLDLKSGAPVFSLHGQASGTSALLVDTPAKLAVVSRNWEVKTFGFQSPGKPTKSYSNLTITRPGVPSVRAAPDGSGLVLYDARHLALTRPLDTTEPATKSKVTPHPYNEIMYLDYLSPHQLVILERPYADILATLPPAFASKLYTGQQKKRLAA